LAVLPAAAAGAESPPALAHRFYIAADEARSADPRALAAALVARLRRGCDEAGAAAGPSPLEGGYELVVMVPVSALDSIARDGLRNQHETATSGGFMRPAERFEAEQELAMLRLPYDARGRELLPKYAVLRAAALGERPLPTRYGAAALVLKPETAGRATWTYADSLDFSRRAGLFELEGEANSVLPRTFAYKRRRGDKNACGNYCEAQIWGPVTLDDVSAVVVPEGVPAPAAFARAGVVVRRGPRAAPDARAAAVRAGAEALRRGREAAALGDAALIAAVEASTAPERARLAGELASRPPAPAVRAELERLARSPDALERELALYGLAAEPEDAFKPALLAGLKDPSPHVQIEAVALADERRADPDVARALAALRASVAAALRRPAEAADRRPVAEWLDRLDAPSLCPDPAAR
jgi:hypothetical protein